MTRKHRGFTLIELLVVIAIIGILASVVLVSLNSARVKARNASYISQVKEYQKALEIYFSQNGSYPPTSTWACIGTGHTNSRCYNNSNYSESSVTSIAFREAMNSFIDSTASAGPTAYTNAGAMYRSDNSAASYRLLLLFEGVELPCPIGDYVAVGSLTNQGLTRCDYIHPL